MGRDESWFSEQDVLEASMMDTRGGGKLSAGNGSKPSGNGCSFKIASRSVFIQGSNAPSILR